MVSALFSRYMQTLSTQCTHTHTHTHTCVCVYVYPHETLPQHPQHRMREQWLVLLPESMPFVAELMEDSDVDVRCINVHIVLMRVL
jgi:hypothetical protein